MKANEMMMGDWVQIDGTPQRVNYINLEDGERVATDKNYFAMPSGCYDPISVTPEIMVENGFVLHNKKIGGRDLYHLYKDGSYGYNLGNKRRAWASAWKGKHGWILEIHFYRNAYCKMPGRIKKYFDYVHELQHVLRLCGLNELADNFKV